MLSGVVFSACNTASIVDARLGIAGQRQCAGPQKGNYYLRNLPFGKTTLAAWAEGYVPFHVEIVIVPGGNVLDIHLDPVNGCTAPAPPHVECTCTEMGCPGF